MPKVTMKDIAEVCGVSVMTVSNAFNRPDQLSSELRERVLARAAKMGYAGPDATARHLRSGKSNCYGVVFSETLSYAFNDPFSIEWLAGFAEVMEQRQASVLLLSVPVNDPASLDAVRNAPIDGLAGICPSNKAIDVGRQRGLPTVVTSASEGYDQVIIDDHGAALEMAGHLVRLGHRRIAIAVETPDGAMGPVEIAPDQFEQEMCSRYGHGFFDTWDRLRGLLAGFEGCDVRIVHAGPNSRESGRRASTALFDRHDRPTAVVCLSDVLALGVMDAMAERGLTPGRDVSVTGFDDLPDSAPAGLTTVRQPIRDKGRFSAELLLDPNRQPRVMTLPHELVVRRSTGPAPH